MVHLVVGADERHSFLVAESERALRKFLRGAGIQPASRGFSYILPPPCIRLSTYRLAGDQHIRIAAMKLPRITWGELALHLLTPGWTYPKYGTLCRG